MRFRHSLWADDEQPTLAAIDAVTGDQPVALSSADMHCGWVNSAAARRLGVHVDESGLVGELEWFNAYTAFDKAPGAAEETDRLLREAEQDAASKGVVGIRDYEMAENIDTWIKRFKAGVNNLRVDAGVYPERLQAAIDAGWHTGRGTSRQQRARPRGCHEAHLGRFLSTPAPLIAPRRIRASSRRRTAP